jgi:competence protein ComFA
MQLLLSDIKSDPSVAQAVPAMTADGRCVRCGQNHTIKLPIGLRYCPVCVNLGRVVEGQSLYRFDAPKFPPTHSLTWSGKLTPAQQVASDQLLKSVQVRREHLSWIIHLGIWDMKSHLAGLKATFGALRILTEQRSW